MLLISSTFQVHLINLLFMIGGIVLLYFGAEGVIVGARRAALRIGITPLVVGLTVVAFGTSMPEAAGSFVAQLRGHAGNIALGNVIGSNIANVGLILGIAALIRPVPTSHIMRVREMPIMLGILVLALLFMIGNRMGRVEGAILVALMAIYFICQVYWGRHGLEASHKEAQARLRKGWKPIAVDWIFIVVGIAALIVGAMFLIDGASRLAQMVGLSNRIVGLTIIAIGTSLPELATSVLASARKEADIAIGNIVGSNILNIVFVAGGVALISPITFESRLLLIDGPVMVGFSLLLWIFLWFQKSVGRWQGSVLLVLYALYIAGVVIFRI